VRSFDLHRIEPDEQVFQLLYIGEKVATGMTHEASIGVHTDYLCVLMSLRIGIPGVLERRIQGELISLRGDVSDSHNQILAQMDQLAGYSPCR
jgi:hypothetical protein